MTYKWTAGPWDWIGANNKITVYAVGGDSITRVHVNGMDEADILRAEANAHLIAAAPDLVEALEALVTRTEPYTIEQGYDYWIDKAIAALAKARGEK